MAPTVQKNAAKKKKIVDKENASPRAKRPALADKTNSSSRPKRKIKRPKRYVLVDTQNVQVPRPQQSIAREAPKNLNNTIGKENLSATRTPIYKNKVITNKNNDSELNVSDKLALYNFEFDPDNEPKPVKVKSTAKRAIKPIKKRKMLSESLSKAAMATLLKDIKKIRAAKLLRKLRLKKKLKDAENAILEAENDDHFDDNQGPDLIFEPNSPDRNSPEFFQEPQIIVTSTPCVGRSSIKSIGSPWRLEVKTVNKSWNYSVKPSMMPAYERDSCHIVGSDDKLKDVPIQNNNVVKKPTRFTQKDILSLFKMRRSPRKTNETSLIQDPTILSLPEFNVDSENSDENEPQQAKTEKRVALFEDPEEIPIVHYNKPTRKIYERSRKQPVRFQSVAVENQHFGNSEVDDGEEYVVTAKTVRKKKNTKTQRPTVSKKEIKQLNEWAAGFNSMLEEAEDFDLCVE